MKECDLVIGTMTNSLDLTANGSEVRRYEWTTCDELPDGQCALDKEKDTACTYKEACIKNRHQQVQQTAQLYQYTDCI